MLERRYISVREAANYLGMSTSAIRKWQRRGTIPFCKMNGSVRFDLQKLDVWAQFRR